MLGKIITPNELLEDIDVIKDELGLSIDHPLGAAAWFAQRLPADDGEGDDILRIYWLDSEVTSMLSTTDIKDDTDTGLCVSDLENFYTSDDDRHLS